MEVIIEKKTTENKEKPAKKTGGSGGIQVIITKKGQEEDVYTNPARPAARAEQRTAQQTDAQGGIREKPAQTDAQPQGGSGRTDIKNSKSDITFSLNPQVLDIEHGGGGGSFGEKTTREKLNEEARAGQRSLAQKDIQASGLRILSDPALIYDQNFTNDLARRAAAAQTAGLAARGADTFLEKTAKNALITAGGTAANFISGSGDILVTMARIMELLDDIPYAVTKNEKFNLDRAPGLRDSAALRASDTFAEAAQEASDKVGKGGKLLISTGRAAGSMMSSAALFGNAFGSMKNMGAAARLTEIAESSPLLTSSLSRAGAKAAIEILSNPGNVGISLNSAVNSYSEALAAGARIDQAMINGLYKGLTEYFSNKLFSGTPFEDTGEKAGYVTRLSEYVAEKLGMSDVLKNFNNTAGGRVFNWIFDKMGEGLEEVVTGIADPLIDKLTYNWDADLATADELIDQWLGGFLLSLLMSGGEAALTRGAGQAEIAAALESMGVERERAKAFAPQLEKAISAMQTIQDEALSDGEGTDTAPNRAQLRIPDTAEQTETAPAERKLPSMEELRKRGEETQTAPEAPEATPELRITAAQEQETAPAERRLPSMEEIQAKAKAAPEGAAESADINDERKAVKLPPLPEEMKTESGLRIPGIEERRNDNGQIEAAAAAGAAEEGKIAPERNTLSGGDAGRRGAELLGKRTERVPGKVRNTANDKRHREIIRQRQKAAVDEPVRSADDIGVPYGSRAQVAKTMPEWAWDDEVSEGVKWAYGQGIKKVVPVLGLLQIEKNGRVASVNAVIDKATGAAYVRADSLTGSFSENLEHEVGHWKSDSNTVKAFMEAVKSKYKESAWRPVYEAYRRVYAKITNDYADMSPREAELYVWEEILEDAYSNNNRFGVRAGVYGEEADAVFDAPKKLILPAPEEKALPESGQSRAAGIRGPPEEERRATRPETGGENVIVEGDVTLETVRAQLQEIYDRPQQNNDYTFPIFKETPFVYEFATRIPGRRSFVMHAAKAASAMLNRNEDDHNLGVDGLIRVISKLEDPDYIIYQQSGRNAGHYVAIISLDDGMSVAVVDIDNYRSGSQGTPNGRSGFYDVLVTAYNQLDRKAGKNYATFEDYILALLESEDNDVVYDKEKDEDALRVALSERLSGRAEYTSSKDKLAQTKEKVKASIEITLQRDADYMAAVERGDMETAQRMVDEAAEAALPDTKILDEDGKPLLVYHGTEADFTVFDRGKGRANMDIQGMFFSPWEIDAGGYGSKIGRYFLNIKNPASEAEGYRALNKFKGQNQAGIKAREYLESLGYDGVNNENEEVIAFYPSQIKSADPVTYDDNGNVIPLSERFNPEKEDIRYSAAGAVTDVSPEDFSSLQDFAASREARAATAKAERMRNIGKEDFAATPALKKLGIRIANSVGIYSHVDQLIAGDRAAKQIQKETRKAERRLDATAKEKNFASGIAAGIYSTDDIPAGMDSEKVVELADYYIAEQAVAADRIRQQRADIGQALDEKMRELFRDSDDFNPSKAIVLNYRTPERNMLHIFGDERGKEINAAIFGPVAVNEAERFRFVNRMHDSVRTFADKNGKQKKLTKAERAVVQQVIEGRAAAEMVAGMEMRSAIENAAQNIRKGKDAGDAAKEFSLSREEEKLAIRYARWMETEEAMRSGKIDTVKVEAAAKKYGELFNQFYDAINDFLVAHGYEPIGFIKGYAPHIQPDENQNLLNKAFNALGINTDVTRLPSSIAGLTANYKPNKRWNPYFLQRTSDITEFDIAAAFESYVDYMSDVIYHTDDIMRVRAANRYFRQTYAPEEIKENLSWANELRYGSTEEKADFLRERNVISKATALTPADVEAQMDEYVEKLFGNIKKTTKYSDFVMWLDNYANVLAGKQNMADRSPESLLGREFANVGNKLVRIFAQANVAGNISSMLNQTAQVPMIQAELGSRWTAAAIKDMITGKLRRGEWAGDSDFLTGKKGIEYLVSTPGEMVVTAMFKPIEIMDTAVSTIAVRGKYLKEIRAGKSHAEAMKAADAFGTAVMGSRMKGSKPLAFSSKNVILQAVNIFQIEAFNSWEHISQDLPRDFRTIEKEQGRKKAALALAGVILKGLLLAFIMNRLAEKLYGGTPAPFDLLGLTANFIASGEGLSTNAYIETLIDNALEQIGGERLFDTDADKIGNKAFDWEKALDDLGYNISNDIPFLRNVAGLLGWGDETLPMPDIHGTGKDLIESLKSRGTSWDAGKAALAFLTQFIPGGRQINKSALGLETVMRGGDFSGTGEKEKLKYPTKGDAWSTMQALTFGKYATEASDSYYASGAKALSENQTRLWRSLTKSGADSNTVYDAIQSFREISGDDELTSFDRGKQERDLIRGLDLTDDQKLEMYRVLKGADSRAEDFKNIMNTGLSFGNVMDVFDEYERLRNDESMNASARATAFAAWVDQQGYKDKQTEVIKDQLRYWFTIPAKETSSAGSSSGLRLPALPEAETNSSGLRLPALPEVETSSSGLKLPALPEVETKYNKSGLRLPF